jgi:molybdopterin molybdotransferase
MRTGVDVAEAERTVLAATPILGEETVATRDALARVLAQPIVSERTLPPADCSAMDGYAVRLADLAGAGEANPGTLHVAYEVPAGGEARRALESGEAARIFTGAPIPPGADCVVRQEDTEVDGEHVRILIAPQAHDHIRNAGEELEVGDPVLEPGTVLRAAHLGALASLGRSVVAVHQRPRVAILSGGNELVEPDGDVAGGRIVSSNSYTLAAMCRELGAEPVYLGIARDDPEDIERRLRSGLGADCIVSSAGVSVGDHDHVRGVLEKLGCRLQFWGVRMKPGYPLAFGTIEAGPDGPVKLVFGLPGNPVSTAVTFHQFVRPALLKMMGRRELFLPSLRARLAHDLDKKPGRLHFVRVQLERRDGENWASSTGTQSSGVLLSMVAAQGLLIFPEAASFLAQGETVTVQVLDPAFFARERSEL